MAAPRVAAGILFLDEAGRVFLVRPTYKPHWEIPGGFVEPGESPRAACVREVREELRLTVQTTQLLVVDWAPAKGEGDKILFVFDGGILTDDVLASIVFGDGELDEWRFVDPARLDDYVPGRLSRRLRLAISARRRNAAAYAEHGVEADQ